MRRKLSDIEQPTWDRTKQLRRELTPAEKHLWRHLRGDQLGAPFRKQHPIGPYIVDFCCARQNLIVEVDGDSHFREGEPERDSARTAFLVGKGWRILRYTNTEVMQNVVSVIADIQAHL